MTVTIDNAWLADVGNGGPNGPWQLSVTNETYQLTVDVTCNGSGFEIAASGITFDLNGHTISYGNYTQPTVLNPYFSTNTVPGTPDNWSIAGASAATVVAITDNATFVQCGFRDWAANCLKLASYTTTQVIESDAIAVPTANILYCVQVLAKATSGGFAAGLSLTTEVIDQTTGLPIGGSSVATTNNLGNAASIPFYFTPTTTHNVKIRFTITPRTSGAAATIYMSNVIFKTARHRGIRLTFHTGVVTCTITSTSGLGVITNPNENPISPCVSNGQSSGFMDISNLDITSSGLDSHHIDLSFCSGATVYDCVFDDNGSSVSNRQAVICAIAAIQAFGVCHFYNNTFTNLKHYGIFCSEVETGSTVHNNTINTDSRYTDPYAITAGDCLNGIEIYENTINQTSGRGILVDMYSNPWGPILIHDNDVTVYEFGNLEFGTTGLEVPALRIRNISQYATPDIQVYDNVFTAMTDSATNACRAAVAVRITNRQAAPVNWQILRNICKAIITKASSSPSLDASFWACAFVISQAVPYGIITVEGNTFESNCVSASIGNNDSFGAEHAGVIFRSNTFKQNTVEGSQNGYLPLQIGPQAAIVNNIQLIGNLFFGATPAINYSNAATWGDWNPVKQVFVGWLDTVTVTNSIGGAPINNATCQTFNTNAAEDDNEATNSSGVAVVVATVSSWTQPGNNAAGRTQTVLSPHTLDVTRTGFEPQYGISLGTLTADTTKSVSLVQLAGDALVPIQIVAGLRVM